MSALLCLLLASARADAPREVLPSASSTEGVGGFSLLHPLTPPAGGYSSAFYVSSSDDVGNRPEVRRVSAAHLGASYGLASWLRLDAHVPYNQAVLTGGDDAFGLGRARVGLTVPLIQADSGQVGFALAPYVLAAGDAEVAAALDRPTAPGAVVALGGGDERGGWRINADLRAEDAFQARLGAGAETPASTGLRMGAEVIVALVPSRGEGQALADTSGRLYALVGRSDGLHGVISGGAGLTADDNTFDRWDMAAGIGYRGEGRRAGLRADGDRCPYADEDVDGYQDDDGCPDPDNDNDGVPDTVDQCPSEIEDRDGFLDRDGCPDIDNDWDGVLDVDDACPLVKGSVETRGCPDTDGDGLADPVDECPLVRGHASSFGCPDMDSDDVPDHRDDCKATPDSPGADPKTSDGCPDDVYLSGDLIRYDDQIFFDFNQSTLKPEAYSTLMRVADLLHEHPEIQLVQISGHSDAIGGDSYNYRLAERRAAAVRRFLVEEGGVSRRRLMIESYGERRPQADNTTDEGRAQNRRVELIVIERSDGSRRRFR